ncbi:MAG: IS4 family transposase, partial [Desulfomonilia bacterium]|nr:IS4 family transposase [Desulfomonilia bacterium]
VKLHTFLDLRGSIPTLSFITEGKVHDVNILDCLLLEAGSLYIMDRGYLDYTRLYAIHLSQAVFVIRAKSNTKFKRVYSHPVDRTSGLICDQTGVLTGFYTAQGYPDKIRRIKFYDNQTRKRLVFLTNNFILPALTIAQVYKCRWKIELFFKWIKQHLRIKAFYGTTTNAVKTKIWISISVYVLVTIMKKQLHLNLELYTILQILSFTLFEKTSLLQLLTNFNYTSDQTTLHNQLNLFTNKPDNSDDT